MLKSIKPSVRNITNNHQRILRCTGIIIHNGHNSSVGNSCGCGTNPIVQRRDQSNGSSSSSGRLPMMSPLLILPQRSSITPIIHHSRRYVTNSNNCDTMPTPLLSSCHPYPASRRGVSTNNNATGDTTQSTSTTKIRDDQDTKLSSNGQQQQLLDDDTNDDIETNGTNDTQSTTTKIRDDQEYNNNNEDEDEDDEDEWEEEPQRTFRQNIRAALWVEPYPDPIDTNSTNNTNKQQRSSLRSPAEWAQVLRLTWSAYKETWEGFSDNMTGSGSYDKNQSNDGKEKNNGEEDSVIWDKDALLKTTGDVSDNANRNVNALREEGPRLVEFVKEATGVRNKRELKEWAAAQIKLASVCVNTFMTGYRKGRDEEVDKMLNEYFKEIDEEEEEEEEEKGVEQMKKGRTGGRQRRNRKKKMR